MKKIFFTVLVSVFAISLFAQDKEMKNLRFGATVIPSLSWYKPDNLKKFESNGVVARFGVLLNGEYSFSGNFAFGFGLGLNSGGGKMTFLDTARYYFNDDAIISAADTNGLKGQYSHYKLNDRLYNASYYVLPFSLKMRTNEIGYMRYFMEPRLSISIRKKVRVDDDVITLSTADSAGFSSPPFTGPTYGQTANQTDLDVTKDMSFLKFSVTISAGGEYYMSGSTALVFALGYDYGLSNAVQKKSEFLIRNDGAAVEQKFTQHGVVLTVGILF